MEKNIMNYPTFLKKVEQLASLCDADSLRTFVYGIARMVPEADRRRFLSILNDVCNTPIKNLQIKKEGDEDLGDRIDALLKALENIQAGERGLESEYNEEWDEWGNDEEEAYLFSDPGNLLDDIEASIEVLHQCVDQGEYEKGARLAKMISELTIRVSGDCDDDKMGIRELVAYNILDIDLKKTVKEAMYLALMGSQEQERAEKMLEIRERFKDNSVSLEEILQTGPDDIDLNSLLPSWIEALAKRPAAIADQLLEEAQDMLQDKNAAVDYASCYAESHPVLYRNILSKGLKNASSEEMMQIGLRGMKEVPVDHQTRSEISLFTAKYALAVQKYWIAEDCWLEAFRTSPVAENYLRLRLQSREWAKYVDTVRSIYTSYYADRGSWEERAHAALLFFDERFEEMIDRFMVAGTGIGWSSTFMKEGIALMLMLLDAGRKTSQGMSAMQNIAIRGISFDSASYCMGTDLQAADSNAELFQDCFQKWKAQVVLPESACESWMEKIDKWIALRVSAIMNANRRGYYDECAAFVAAFGEVKESRGKPGEKDKTLQQYKAEYSRRRAFHGSLRRFGLKK